MTRMTKKLINKYLWLFRIEIINKLKILIKLDKSLVKFCAKFKPNSKNKSNNLW